jgi:hypothetical protein
MLETLEIASFEPYVGGSWALDAGAHGGPLTLVLERVTGLGGPALPGGRRPFSLTFRGPRDPVLPQRIYRLESDVMAPLDIVIVPVGRDQTATRYEAIFT